MLREVLREKGECESVWLSRMGGKRICLVSAWAVEGQGKLLCTFSPDLGRTWTPPQVIAGGMHADKVHLCDGEDGIAVVWLAAGDGDEAKLFAAIAGLEAENFPSPSWSYQASSRRLKAFLLTVNLSGPVTTVTFSSSSVTVSFVAGADSPASSRR